MIYYSRMEILAHILRDVLGWLADFGLATLAAFGVCWISAFTWWMFRDVQQYGTIPDVEGDFDK